MIGEDPGHHMSVIDLHAQDPQFEDQDHHPAAQEDHGVDVPGAPVVEMTDLMLVRVLLTGGADHRPHSVEIRSRHLVGHPQTPLDSPRPTFTPAEWHSPKAQLASLELVRHLAPALHFVHDRRLEPDLLPVRGLLPVRDLLPEHDLLPERDLLLHKSRTGTVTPQSRRPKSAPLYSRSPQSLLRKDLLVSERRLVQPVLSLPDPLLARPLAPEVMYHLLVAHSQGEVEEDRSAMIALHALILQLGEQLLLLVHL